MFAQLTHGGRPVVLLLLAILLLLLGTDPGAAALPSLTQPDFIEIVAPAPAGFSIYGENQVVAVGQPTSELVLYLKNDGELSYDQIKIWGAETAVTRVVEVEVGAINPFTTRAVAVPLEITAGAAEQAILIDLVVSMTGPDGATVQLADIVQFELVDKQGSIGTVGDGERSLAESTGQEPAEWTPPATPPTVSLFTASAAYRYPIEVPPGAAGLQPNLGLSYSSHGANMQRQGKPQSDPSGWGWRLGGGGEITQQLELCLGDQNFLCVLDGPETPSATAPTLSLSFDGGSYGVIHRLGPDHNGTAGRYYANGNATLYVELCGGSNPSLKCRAADTADNQPGSGRLEWGSCPTGPYNPAQAGCHQSRLFWIVKTADNRLYRFGYRANSEQEVVPGRVHGGTVPTLRWRLDEVRDPFGNTIDLTYTEAAMANVHTATSHLASMTYEGIQTNRIDFSYTGQSAYGNPQAGSRPVVSWQTRRLDTIQIWHGSKLFREVELVHFTTRHGCLQPSGSGCQAEMLPGRVSQMGWCEGADFWSGAGLNWKAMLLIDIVERIDSDGDGSADQTMTTRPAAGFNYEFRGVDVINGSGWQYRVCRPYMTGVLAPLSADPIARFYYSWVDQGGANYHSFVTIKRLFPGSGDAPVQRVQYTHHDTAVDPANDNLFQGYRLATEQIYAVDHPDAQYIEQIRQTEFIAASSDRLFETAWHGRPKKETVQLRQGEQMRVVHEQIYEYRTQVGSSNDSDYQPYQRHTQLVESRSIEINPVSGARWGAATFYQYDGRANPVRVIKYAQPDGAGSPETTVVSTYQGRTDGDVWLPGLLTSRKTFGSDGRLIAEDRYRYDRQSCHHEIQLLGHGLLTAVDQRHDGNGQGECGYGSAGPEEWLTTRYYYGSYQSVYGRPWQQTAVVDPAGRTAFVAYRTGDPIRIARQFMRGDGLVYQNALGYNDARFPWKVTHQTGPNGAQSRLIYDQFGRLVAQYGANGATGEPTVRQKIIDYQLNQLPAAVTVTTTPDDAAVAVSSRHYLNGLGQVVQQVNVVPTSTGVTYGRIDRGYDGQGRPFCTAPPQPVSQINYQSGVRCTAIPGHQVQKFDPLGRTVQVTAGHDHTTTTLHGRRKTLALSDGFRYQAGYFDFRGQMVRREEGVAQGTDLFEQLDRTLWQLFGSSGTHGVSEADGLFIRSGGTGQYGFSRAVNQAAAERDVAVTYRFKAQDSTNGWMWTNLERGSWADGSYRAWGIVSHRVGQELHARLLECTGQSCSETTLLTLQPNSWYEVALRAGPGCDDAFAVIIWPEGEPQRAVEIQRDHCDGQWSSNRWNFIFKTQNQAGVTYSIDDFAVHELVKSHYRYDSAGRLTDVTDESGRTLQSMAYNFLGQKTAVNDVHLGEWTYSYDVSGNIVYQRSGRNDGICLDYDSLNRLVHKRSVGQEPAAECAGAGHVTLAEYRYGVSGSELGMLMEVAWAPDLSQNGEVFAYDAAGRLTSHTRTINGRPFTMGYDQFDHLNRPTVVTYPDGERVSTVYDGYGADQLLVAGQPFVNRVDHNVRGQAIGVRRATGHHSEFRYGAGSAAGTAEGRLTDLIHQFAGDHLHYRYRYDSGGNLMALEENNRSPQTYTYDSLDRLTQVHESGSVTRAYRYDAAGNIVARVVGTDTFSYTYDPVKPQWVTAIARNGAPENSYGYDLSGNMVDRTVAGISYQQEFDIENRLFQISWEGETTRFFYDDIGRRTMSERDGRVIYYPFPEYEEEVEELPEPLPTPLTPTAQPTNTATAAPPTPTSQPTAVPPTPTATATTAPPTPTIVPGRGPFLEENGQVVMEAEHFHTRSGGATGHTWQTSEAFSGAVNGQSMQVYPNSGRNNRLSTSGPEMGYDIHFATPGTYTIYIRGLAPNGSNSDDSVLVGLNGQPLDGAYTINQFRSTFTWRGRFSGSDVTLTIITPGLYTLNLWMREDGFVADRILLARGGASGLNGSSSSGPPESDRLGGVSPTMVPTQPPTTVPTAGPTAIPTRLPTAVPTAEPTTVPTAYPTIVPTEPPIRITIFPRPTIWPTPPIRWEGPDG